MAVAKVEQLTQQLEEIRTERANQKNGEKSAAAIELEKLKQELMVGVGFCFLFLCFFHFHQDFVLKTPSKTY